MSTTNNQSTGSNESRGAQPEEQPRIQEKTTLGGDYNSGVTSSDPAEKDEIEKKGALANIDQSQVRTEEQRKAEDEA